MNKKGATASRYVHRCETENMISTEKIGLV